MHFIHTMTSIHLFYDELIYVYDINIFLEGHRVNNCQIDTLSYHNEEKKALLKNGALEKKLKFGINFY